MLTLAFDVGDMRLALPATTVVEVLPRHVLRPAALAPAAVAGLLAFRGTLTPVVDLCRLMVGRDCRPLRSSRIIVTQLPAERGRRLVGLLAENVLDLVDAQRTVHGLRLPEAPWLGEHLADQPGLPQLVDVRQLLPEALAALFEEAVSP